MSVDTSDRSFLQYLKEISRSYTALPKQLRLRVEKWVEKLSQTGSNPTWKKHRNLYARLLLNSVLSKTLNEPFHVNPPDGALPTFPSHLRSQLKDSMGAHESSFWRDIFSNVELDNSKVVNDHSTQFESKGRVPRELQDLQLVVKEQTKRIELLEQQLHEERLQHELQIQRLQVSHKSELEKYMQRSFVQAQGSDGSVKPSDLSIATNAQTTERPRTSVNSSLATIHHPQASKSPPRATGISSLDRLSSPGRRLPPPVPAFDYLKQHIESNILRTERLKKENESFLQSSSSGIRSHSHSLVKPPAQESEDDPLNLQSTVRTTAPLQEDSKEPSDNDDFLEYLERFQREIKNLQLASPKYAAEKR